MPAPGALGVQVYVQNTAPLNPSTGDFWYDTSAAGVLNFRSSGSWIQIDIPTTALDTLSNSVSVLSNAVSVLSNATSALSQKVSVLSQAVSVVSNAISAVSLTLASVISNVGAVSATLASVQSNVAAASATLASVISQVSLISSNVAANSATLTSVISQVSLISANLQTLSVSHSVLSAGIGAVQMQVVAGSQAAFSAIAKISGLSCSLALSTYQIDGMLLFSTSGTASVNFGFSVSTAVLATFAGLWEVLVSATSNISVGGAAGTGGIQVGGFTGVSNTQVAAIVGSTGTLQWAHVRAIARVTTAGSMQMKATPVTGGPLTILQGSYLRAFKIG